MTVRFDAIIIGTGQAGPALAARLSDSGMKVAVTERKLFGGTCVNTGCVPTKTLVASAYAAHLARRAAEYGVERPRKGPGLRNSGERRLAREHFVQHAGKRVDVARGIQIARAARLLGAHICGRPDGDAGVGEAGLGVQSARDAEVRHQRVIPGEHDVLGFHIAMDDPVAVGVVERVGGLSRDP